jgi:hypothetical protein
VGRRNLAVKTIEEVVMTKSPKTLAGRLISFGSARRQTNSPDGKKVLEEIPVDRYD